LQRAVGDPIKPFREEVEVELEEDDRLTEVTPNMRKNRPISANVTRGSPEQESGAVADPESTAQDAHLRSGLTKAGNTSPACGRLPRAPVARAHGRA